MAFLRTGDGRFCYSDCCTKAFTRFVYIGGDEVPVCAFHLDLVVQVRAEASALMAWFDKEQAA